MARRVYAVKVTAHRGTVRVSLLGRGDRGQLSLIAFAAGPVGNDLNKTSQSLMEGAFEAYNRSISGNSA